jgi:2',3'-cyclic-nucleotide 2'-phosphodiesterase (5'-nucleotidase family)
VGGVPLSATATYTIANSDYVANGGDETSVLRSIPQESNGYLMRDALFDYIRKLKSQGKGIVASIENRVRYAE